MTPNTKKAETKIKEPTPKELEEARLQAIADNTSLLIDSVIELKAQQTHVTDRSIGVVGYKLKEAIALAEILSKQCEVTED